MNLIISKHRLMTFYSIVGAFFIASPASAQLDERLQQAGWAEFVFEQKRENHFSVLDNAPAKNSIHITTDNAVSIAYMPFAAGQIDLQHTPYLSFAWARLGQAIDTDLTQKGGDDRIASLYIAFPYQPDKASFTERLTRPFVESRKGKDAPGRVLTYLWGGGARVGKWFENPYTGKAGWMKILQTPDAPPDIWFEHSLNIKADFLARFGYMPPPPSYIAVGADSDDTMSNFQVKIKNIEFSTQP